MDQREFAKQPKYIRESFYAKEVKEQKEQKETQEKKEEKKEVIDHKFDLEIIKQINNLLPEEIDLIVTKKYRAAAEKYYVIRNYAANQRLLAKSHEEFQLIKQTASTLLEQKGLKQDEQVVDAFEDFYQSLQPQLTIGDKFFPIQDLVTLATSQPNPQLKLDQFTIIILVVSWSGTCSPALNQMMRMMIKYKINIIAISLESDSAEMQQKVQQVGWQYPFYRIAKGWDFDNNLLSSLDIKSLPYFIALNKINQVIYLGCGAGMNWDEFITKWQNSDEVFEEKHLQKKENPQEILLSKEDFSRYKKVLRDKIFPYIDEVIFHEQLDIDLNKSFVLNKDDTKQLLSRSLIHVEIRTWNEQIPEHKKLWEFARPLIPLNLVQIDKKFYYYEPEEEYEESKRDLMIMFKNAGIPIKYKQRRNLRLHALNSEAKLKLIQQYEWQVDKYDKKLFLKVYEEGKKKLIKEVVKDENQLKLLQFMDEVLKGTHLKEGEPFQTITGYHDLQNKEVTIKHEEGVLLIIVYFAYWNQESLNNLLQFSAEYRMMVQEKLFNDEPVNIRFVALSAETIQDSKQLVYGLMQQGIEAFFPRKQFNKDQEIYGYKSLPYYIVVGYDGIIEHVGIPEVNQEILKKYEKKFSKKGKEQQFVCSSNVPELRQKLQKRARKLKALKYAETLTLELIYDIFQIYSAKIRYQIRQHNKDVLNDIRQDLQLLSDDQIDIEGDIQETFDIKFPGGSCSQCNAELTDQKQQYFCKFTDKYYCVQCAENEDPEKQITDNLIFINAPVHNQDFLKNIDMAKMGKNVKPPKGSKALSGFNCNHCNGAKESGKRYISLAPYFKKETGYVDYCHDCFLVIKKRTKIAYENMRKDFRDNYTTIDCPILRITVHHDYYKF